MGTGNIQLFDWDEINFAQISREMFVSGDIWQPTINFLPFHEKPPLFNWLQLLCFQFFGVNEMAARLPNVLAGGLTLWTIYYIGSRWRGHSFGWWWMIFMAFSLLPQLYFRSGIIDPWFNFFIFTGLAVLLGRSDRAPRWTAIVFGGLLLGLGVMTKGPVAVLVAGLCLGYYGYFIQSATFANRWWRYTAAGLIALLPTLLWIAYIWTLDDGFFAREFLAYQWRLFSQPDAGHGGFPGYHAVVLLLGCFPASIFALPRLFTRSAHPPEQLLKVLFWVILILFSVVSTKIVHYSSLAYFPITFLAAAQLEQLRHGASFSKLARNLSRGIWGIYAAVLLLLPLLIHLVLPYVKFYDLDYQSSKAFNKASVYYLPLLAFPLVELWRYVGELAKAGRWHRYAASQIVGIIYLVAVGLYFYIGPIQQMTQGAYVAFYQENTASQPYFGTAYHKSYAPLFYGQVGPENGGKVRNFRFHGPTERPLYFSSPLWRKEQVLREVPDAKWLYDFGGYSFYLRPVASPAN